MISLKEICSAGSKDGCIKLWKISKNYTVLQPLYSIPMVGRFRVIFTYMKISCADPKNVQGWGGGPEKFVFEMEGIRGFFRYKNYYVNLINLNIWEWGGIGERGVWTLPTPLPLPCTSAHRNMITFLRLWFLFFNIHVINETHQHASNGFFPPLYRLVLWTAWLSHLMDRCWWQELVRNTN